MGLCWPSSQGKGRHTAAKQAPPRGEVPGGRPAGLRAERGGVVTEEGVMVCHIAENRNSSPREGHLGGGVGWGTMDTPSHLGCRILNMSAWWIWEVGKLEDTGGSWWYARLCAEEALICSSHKKVK